MDLLLSLNNLILIYDRYTLDVLGKAAFGFDFNVRSKLYIYIFFTCFLIVLLLKYYY
jgi:hypothetical protein